MKYSYFLFLLIAFQFCSKKPVSRTDTKSEVRIQQNINFLADDKLEGRRAGSPGELAAANYIAGWFKQYGILPKGDNGTYLQPFEIYEGKEAKAGTFLAFDEISFKLNDDYFPLAWSATTTEPVITTLTRSTPGTAWVIDLKDTLTAANNPHFDLQSYKRWAAENAAANGAKAVLFLNSSELGDKTVFDGKDKSPAVSIPVVYLKDKTLPRKMDLYNGRQMMRISVEMGEKRTTGHNVVGYIDNKAANTIVLGAHFDHLGWGDDHNSLYTGSERMIHNGADDNASGTAALIELSGYLASSPLKSYNYLLIAFSGEELGLFGSKYYTQNPTIDLKKVNYMINMDMVGRLNPQTRGLTIGGYGTSPAWANIIKTNDPTFNIKLDTSGAGPSDHTSFYREDIPVLFFFTGTHGDYHKPSDDADKINALGIVSVVNYIKQVLIQTNYEGKLAFTKTKEPQMARSTFKVSLGVMPDYTFSGNGVKVDGISEGKAAQKAGILAGDVLLQLGKYSFNDVQSYMDALNKFDKGQSTTVKLQRGTAVLELPVTFY